MRGEAARWNSRGCGFIKPSDGSEDVFCHMSNIVDGNCLREGDTVEYFTEYDDRKGKYRAIEVTGGRREDDNRGGGGGYGGGYDDRRGGGGCETIPPLSVPFAMILSPLLLLLAICTSSSADLSRA